MKKILSLLFLIAVLFIGCPAGTETGNNKNNNPDNPTNPTTPSLAFELINNGTAYRVRKGTVNSGKVVIPARVAASGKKNTATRDVIDEAGTLPVLEIGAPTDGESMGAFMQTDITEIVIPEGVTSIFTGAFGGCKELVSVTLPESLEIMGHQAFTGTEKLERITIHGKTKIGSSAFIKSGIQEVILEEGITEIPEAMFATSPAYGLDKLTSITLPESLESIGNGAFASQTNLADIVLPNNLKTIGEGAFGVCRGIKTITIPASVTSVGGGAFWGWGKGDHLKAEQDSESERPTIYIEGYASEEEADAAWNTDKDHYTYEAGGWRAHCNVTFVYGKKE